MFRNSIEAAFTNRVINIDMPWIFSGRIVALFLSGGQIIPAQRGCWYFLLNYYYLLVGLAYIIYMLNFTLTYWNPFLYSFDHNLKFVYQPWLEYTDGLRLKSQTVHLSEGLTFFYELLMQ